MKTSKVQILILMFAVYAYPVCTQSTPVAALTTLEVVSNIASLLSIVLDKTDEIHRIQIIDLRSRASGVITTIKEREEANRNAEETLQIVEVDLNQSMELTWSLTQELLKNNAIENAALFTKLYTGLGQLKIIIYQKSGRYSLFNDVPSSITNKINELNKMFSDTCINFFNNIENINKVQEEFLRTFTPKLFSFAFITIGLLASQPLDAKDKCSNFIEN